MVSGAGKSVLCASLIEELGCLDHSGVGFSDDQPVFLYHFFLYNAGKDQSTSMVASLIEQLIRTRIDQQRICQILEEEYDKDCRSLRTLWRAFCIMMDDYPTRVYVILDGLDECEEEDRKAFMDVITESEGLEARFIIASRPENDIKQVLGVHTKFHVIDVDTRDDIEVYIDSVLYELKDEAKELALRPYRDAIYSKVKETSDGMFRYTALIIDELSHQTGDKKIMEILETLPKGLNEMYDLLMKRLPSEEGSRKLRQITLCLILSARKDHDLARTPQYIGYANAVKLDERNFDPRNHLLATEDEIQRSCGLLVDTIQINLRPVANLAKTSAYWYPPPFSNTNSHFTGKLFRFAHRTTQEYFFGNIDRLFDIDPSFQQWRCRLAPGNLQVLALAAAIRG